MTETEKIFSPDGPLADHFENYEQRDAQIRMALAVEEIIQKGGVLLAEAGTGTGKTLAYLAPAICSDSTVIVSTGTKNLQEQIFFKDLSLLSEALQIEINAVYLKGQENYLCIRRLADLLKSPRALSFPPDRVEALASWAEGTHTGDRMEIQGLPDDDPLWREVCSTKESRIGPRCAHFGECFVTRARKAALQAHIVVVNHHLYFADLATRLQGGAILPSHEVAIFDEAHAVEDTATEFFSISVSSSRINRLLEDALVSVKQARLSDDPAEVRRPKLVRAAKRACASFFSLFRGPLGRVKLVPEEIDEARVNAYHKLDSSLEAVEQTLLALEGKDDIIDYAADRFRELRDGLASIVTESATGHVHWVEVRSRSVALGASPIDVSTQLREGLFFSVPKVVLTSATLCADGDFSFLKSRLGIDFDVDELSLASPFDFPRQACVYIPSHIVDPRDDDFVRQAAGEAAALIRITGGGALVLCTSVRNMTEIFELLKEEVEGPLLLQGEAPKSILIDRFKTDQTSVLCATASFWQGVDLPGEALRLVVIDKLPFASPGDPLTNARIEHIREQGRNPFVDYQVPTAILALKQGFGRLIRTRTDQGIVAVLDHRLHTKGYARSFLRSLPECPRLSGLDEVKRWWRQARGQKESA